VQDHRPRDGGRGASRRERRVLLARLQHDEGLLQDARRHGRDDRPRRLAALGRSRLPRRGRKLPHHGPAQGHDHPRRRKHLPQGDRGVSLHAPRRQGRAGHRRAGQEVRRGGHGLRHSQGAGQRHGGRAHGVHEGASRAAQGAQVHRVRRFLPHERRGQGAEVQDARGRGAPPGARERRRHRHRHRSDAEIAPGGFAAPAIFPNRRFVAP